MIRGIHYFSTKLKTKIDVIPRGCFKNCNDYTPPPPDTLWGGLRSSTFKDWRLKTLSHTHWLSFHYIWDVCRYQPILHSVVLHVYMSYTCCIANECYWLSVGDSPLLWSSVMSVDCTLFCGVHFRAVWKNTAHVLGIRFFLGRALYFPIPHSNEHRLHIVSHSVCYYLWLTASRSYSHMCVWQSWNMRNQLISVTSQWFGQR